jgi:hypothetical protein
LAVAAAVTSAVAAAVALAVASAVASAIDYVSSCVEQFHPFDVEFYALHILY